MPGIPGVSIQMPGSGGGGDSDSTSTTSSPSPAPEPDTTSTTTFDPDTQTLGTTSGVAEQVDSGGVTVDDTTDPTDSSVAGGAGMEEAVERFTGAPNESLSGGSSEQLVDLGNAASNVVEADTEQAHQEAMQNVRDTFASITGTGQQSGQQTGQQSRMQQFAAAVQSRLAQLRSRLSGDGSDSGSGGSSTLLLAGAAVAGGVALLAGTAGGGS